jgi:hypothetical protein
MNQCKELEDLLELHDKLCSDSGNPSAKWLQDYRRYQTARNKLEGQGINVEIAVKSRFMPWVSPEAIESRDDL